MKKRNPFNAISILTLVIFFLGGWALAPRPDPIENEVKIVQEVDSVASDQTIEPLDEATARRYTTYKLLYSLYDAQSRSSHEEEERLMEKYKAMLEEDPYEMLSRLGEVPSLSLGQHALPGLSMSFFKKLDVGTATSLIELTKNNETLYADLLQYWSHDAVYDDPSKHSDFINWAESAMDEPLAKDAITVGYLGMLESQDKSEEIVTKLWTTLNENPPADNKSEAMVFVVNSMIEGGMGEYLEEEISKLEDHEAHAGVFLHYSLDYMSQKDPQESMSLLGKIKNDDYRLSAFIQNGKEWAVRDRSGFANWLAENEAQFTNEELRGLNAELKSNGLDPIVELPTLDEDLAEEEALAKQAQ